MQLLIDLFIAFAGTNIDNFVFITLMLAAASAPAQKQRIVITQYAGLAILVCISLAGSAVLRLIPMAYIRYLGFLPMAIGLRGLWQYRQSGSEADEAPAADIPSFATLVLLNLSSGMDNISIYVPMFQSLRGAGSLMLLAAVFSALLLVWCIAANRLSLLSPIRHRVQRHAAWLVPLVYVLLGVYILLR